MLRVLVKLVLAGAAVAAMWAWVPVKGRTMSERWARSASAGTFVDRTLAELTGGASARPPARLEAREEGRGGRPERPVERHSDEDRRAVDRILSERLASPRG